MEARCGTALAAGGRPSTAQREREGEQRERKTRRGARFCRPIDYNYEI